MWLLRHEEEYLTAMKLSVVSLMFCILHDSYKDTKVQIIRHRHSKRTKEQVVIILSHWPYVLLLTHARFVIITTH